MESNQSQSPRTLVSPPEPSGGSTSAVSFDVRLQDRLASEQFVSEATKFAAWKAETGFREGVYQRTVDLDTLTPGKQLAFEVLLDQCSGCKACVTGCHSMNGLEPTENWRKVGEIKSIEDLIGQDSHRDNTRHVTTACHHCTDPACANGCPVLAYEKDPTTGIVRHLDDQCIGCQYCVMMCPYDVPVYSKRLGIVRKCDLCINRLQEGEAPACVQSCPNEAIRVTVVDKQEIEASTANHSRTRWIPDGPPAQLTSPTTQFVSHTVAESTPGAWGASKPIPPEPEEAHEPLVAMLVLSQWSVGALGGAQFLDGGLRDLGLLLSTVLLIASIVAGALHLGQPLRAWRVFLGWRKSWLSREMIVFGGMAGLLATALCATKFAPAFERPLALSAFFAGLLGVYSSAQIYASTQRPNWKLARTGGRFLGSTVSLGALSALCFSAASTKSPILGNWIAAGVLGVIFLKLSFELTIYRKNRESRNPLEHNCAVLLDGPLAPRHTRRVVLAIATALVVILTALFNSLFLAMLALMLGVTGEYLERQLFFLGVTRYRMP